MSFHVTNLPALIWVLFLALPHLPLPAQARAQAKSSVRLFDTVSPLPALSPDSVLSVKAQWVEVPEDETSHNFRGDAVLANDRLAVALRRGGPGAELYSHGGNGFVLRALLTPGGGGPEAKVTSVSIVENHPGTVAVDAAFATRGGSPLGVRYQLDLGRAFLKTK